VLDNIDASCASDEGLSVLREKRKSSSVDRRQTKKPNVVLNRDPIRRSAPPNRFPSRKCSRAEMMRRLYNVNTLYPERDTSRVEFFADDKQEVNVQLQSVSQQPDMSYVEILAGDKQNANDEPQSAS
jgi:hypothetical protein